jgi:hypothetical protein
MVEGSVKYREKICRLTEETRELTYGVRLFRYHPIGRAVGSDSALPLVWEEQRPNGDWEPVRVEAMVSELNQVLSFTRRARAAER